MSERTEYTPGTFCWTDLTTTDQSAAKDFYGRLFGWQAEDFPMDEGTFYSMQRIDGKDVAAIAPQPPQQREAGVPPTWNSYIAVESADDACRRAQELGATVHAPAFDVMEAGRMGVIQDPQGAYFEVWEAKMNPGAALVNQAGALSWNELASPDLDGSSRFYGELFGWKIEAVEDMPMPYRMIQNAGSANGGIAPLMPPGTPPHWLVYFGTDEIEASTAKLSELGGTVMAGPMDIGVGKIAVVADPQGAVFALYAGQFEN